MKDNNLQDVEMTRHCGCICFQLLPKLVVDLININYALLGSIEEFKGSADLNYDKT